MSKSLPVNSLYLSPDIKFFLIVPEGITFWIQENALNCPTIGHFLMSRVEPPYVRF
jgi:hypothetical protein